MIPFNVHSVHYNVHKNVHTPVNLLQKQYYIQCRIISIILSILCQCTCTVHEHSPYNNTNFLEVE